MISSIHIFHYSIYILTAPKIYIRQWIPYVAPRHPHSLDQGYLRYLLYRYFRCDRRPLRHLPGLEGFQSHVWSLPPAPRPSVKYIPKSARKGDSKLSPLRDETPITSEETAAIEAGNEKQLSEIKTKSLRAIQGFITKGAKAFLFAEYRVVLIFIICFAIILFLLLGFPNTCGPKVLKLGEELCDIANPKEGTPCPLLPIPRLQVVQRH